jgi:hypothetical protein
MALSINNKGNGMVWVFNSMHTAFIVLHPYIIAVYELMVSKFEGIKFPALKLRGDN